MLTVLEDGQYFVQFSGPANDDYVRSLKPKFLEDT